MTGFFTKERFGTPQAVAAVLLFLFVGQCVWLVRHETIPAELNQRELFRIEQGLKQWNGKGIAGIVPEVRDDDNSGIPPEIQANAGYDPNHSPLRYLISSAPILAWQQIFTAHDARNWTWLDRVPFVFFGTLLGASLWYVARRLYGNAGGYIVLILYCFSPEIIKSSSLWFAEPETGAAWGTFGVVFTAIAVAHILYAPREVVLWNWRRIVLLGLSMALAVGSQFSLIILMPVALGFMLYLAPSRRPSACIIWLSASLFALVLLFASYRFNAAMLYQSLRHTDLFNFTWRALMVKRTFVNASVQLFQIGPVIPLILVTTFIIYILWPRVRYFGNTAPLLVFGLFIFLSLVSPHYPGFGFHLMAAPFCIVFVSGVATDCLESDQRIVVTIWMAILLGFNSIWNLIQLARIGT